MSPLQEPEQLLEIMNTLPVGLSFMDKDYRILFWNEAAERITGYMQQEVIGRCCREKLMMLCDGVEACTCNTSCPLTQSMRTGRMAEADSFLRHKNGYQIPVHVKATPIRNAHGSIIGAAEIFEENSMAGLSERRTRAGEQQVLLHPCSHELLEAYIRESIRLRKEHAVAYGVVSIDLVHFTQMVAAHGSVASESVATVVGQSIRNALRTNDQIGRWTKDRFIAVVTNCNGCVLKSLAARLQTIGASSGISWWGDQLTAEVSIRHTLIEADDTLDSLLHRLEESAEIRSTVGGGAVTLTEIGAK